jgi:hypothetical protein
MVRLARAILLKMAPPRLKLPWGSTGLLFLLVSELLGCTTWSVQRGPTESLLHSGSDLAAVGPTAIPTDGRVIFLVGLFYQDLFYTLDSPALDERRQRWLLFCTIYAMNPELWLDQLDQNRTRFESRR